MSQFGGSPSYGTLSPDSNVSYGRPSSRYQEGGGTGERFQNLSDTVSSNIFQINNNTSALERTLKQLIGGKDGQEEKLHRIQQATNDLAGKTTALLKEMSSLCGGSSPSARQQRVQHERLKGEFRESISRYYSVQNKVVEKEKLLVGSSRLPQRQDSNRFGDGEFGNEKSSLMEDDQRRQEQEQLDMQIGIDESLIREREDRIRQIEGDILDINEIFRDLATMVYEQGEIVDSIEANVERAQTNVEGANVQLSKASLYQKKARTKMCILLVIILVVAGIITLIVVVTN
ncbi:t-SNARE domain-containing protein 1 [Desmophyllum pertusum]|uniref:t-SNARE domain-containing protein 1 n=1 Tax=Desmophyllum pertusum TaxID=174260 RepID=A0A9X0CRZ4_9CNID|nr:t-SNARE domain-containing protein 1 [Desmophyllum pertusum]